MVKLVKKHAEPEPDFLPNTRRIASLAADHKAVDLRAYDVRAVTVVADTFIVCSARSEPQAKAIFNAVKMGMKEHSPASRRYLGSGGIDLFKGLVAPKIVPQPAGAGGR